MTLGYWSPMPPSLTGVADYSSALLPFLRAHGEVQINCSGDVNLYHVGNNGLHREIYQQAVQRPGIIVLHDAVLHHFFLGMLDRAAYIEEFVYNYGEWSRTEAEQLWSDRSLSGSDPRYFARPMLKRIVTAATAVIVHNPAAVQFARSHVSDARIFEIPHLFLSPQLLDSDSILDFRAGLGIEPETLLVGAFGHQRETKRLHVLLRAFELALARGANARLLVSGQFVSEILARTFEPLLDRPHILRTGYLAPDEFEKYMAVTDLCVNLRYPSAGESSGIAIQMMGIGKTVLFTSDETIAHIPNDACLRIDPGLGEEEALAEYIVWLAKTGVAATIGANAARYIAREHAPKRVAAAYWEVINKTMGA